MCHVTCVEARGQLKEFLFYHVSWDLTQVARLKGTHLYLRSHLISSVMRISPGGTGVSGPKQERTAEPNKEFEDSWGIKLQ